VVQSDLPAMGESYLAEFVAAEYPVRLLDQTVRLKVEPTAMAWDATGGRIAISSSAVVAGVEGASYVSSPSPAPVAMGRGDGLSVALADDLANQLLAGIWASGALEFTYRPAADDPLQAFLPGTDLIKATLLLPPVAKADGTSGRISLSIGDAIVQVMAGERVLAELAINAEVDLTASIGAGGKLALKTGRPVVHAQVISQVDDLPVQLDQPRVAAFAELSVKMLTGTTDDLFDALPIPGLGDAELTEPTITPLDGYVLLGGSIASPDDAR
jgi:hypothetical protein